MFSHSETKMKAKYVNVHCEWCGRYKQPTFVHIQTPQAFNVMARRVYINEISQTPQKDLVKYWPQEFRLRPYGLELEKTRCVPPTPIGARGLELDGDGVVVVSGHRCPDCRTENDRRIRDLHRKKQQKRGGLGWKLFVWFKRIFSIS